MKLILVSLRFFCFVFFWIDIWTSNSTVLAQTKKPKQPNQLRSLDVKTCTTDLAQAINGIINRPEFSRSHWGIEVQSLASNRPLYTLNGDKFFTPASSLKLLTTAAVLLEFGPEYRLTTPVYSLGNPPNLNYLKIQGQGDPSFSTQDLKKIVRRLKAIGVKKIETLIIEDNYFQPPAINPTWEWLDVHSYFATAVNSTILNENTVRLTLLPQQIGQSVKFHWSDAIAARQWRLVNQGITGQLDLPYNIEIDGELDKATLKIRGELAANESPDIWDLAIVDPSQYFLDSLRFHLNRAGIRVTRGVVTKNDTQIEVAKKLMLINSPSIKQLITTVNQDSNNLYAEALGKILAKKLNKNPTEAIQNTLAKLNINKKEYVLADASGLSRQNLATPETFVRILKQMMKTENSTSDLNFAKYSFYNSLATPGRDGTLKKRFRDQNFTGKLWGKTGSLTGVGSLSGYLFKSSEQAIIFSILLDHSELSNKQIRSAIDEIVVIIDRKSQC